MVLFGLALKAYFEHPTRRDKTPFGLSARARAAKLSVLSLLSVDSLQAGCR